MNKFTKLLILVVVVSAALWSVPAFMRDQKVPFAWTASYDDIHRSRIWDGSIVVLDPQTNQMRLVGPLNMLLSVFGGTPMALRVLGLMSGIIACTGLYLILRKTALPLRTCVLAVALFGVSGAAVVLFGAPSSSGFILALALVSIALVLQDTVVLNILGVTLAMVVALGNSVFLFHVAVAGAMALVLQRRYGWALMYLVLPSLLGFVVWWVIPVPQVWWSLPIVSMLAEFGARPGIGIMEWLLGIIGAGVLWRAAHKRTAIVIAFMVLYISVSANALPFGAPLWSALAAVAIMYLYERQWRYPELKTLSMFAIGCGVLLSLLTVVTGIIAAQPSTAMHEIVAALEADDIVLTDPINADWIVTWSPAAMAYGSHGSPQEERARDQTLQQVWYSRDLRNATIVLDALDINTIVITKAMRDGGVWTQDEEGFLFLLENSEMFKKRFSNDEAEVWNYMPRSTP